MGAGHTNKSWSADKLESLVWEKLECVIANPELIINEIERQRQDADKSGVLQNELQHIQRQSLRVITFWGETNLLK